MSVPNRFALCAPLLIAGVLPAVVSHAADAEPEEVIITATALRAGVEDVIQPVEVLSGDELQSRIASSIGETIAKQPGITGTYFGPNASRPVIRGFSGERVQMLEDGIGALDVSSLSEDHAVSIEDALARQIEIVKGPATLLYGSGAVGGVVNVLTRRIPEKLPTQGIGGVAEMRGDTASRERSGVGALELGASSFALHLDAYDRQTDDVRIPGDAFSRRTREALLAADPEAFIPRGRILNSDSDSQGGAVGASFIGDKGFAGLSVSGFETNYGVPFAPGDAVAAGGARIDMKQTRYDFKAELAGQASWLQRVRLRASHNDYEHRELEPGGAVGTAFAQQGTEARVALDHRLGALQGSAGVQYRHLDFAAQGEQEVFLPPSLTRNFGVFLFEQYPWSALTLETGLRVERQTIDPAADRGLADYNASSVSGSLGGLWKFAPELALAVNVTHSQRHPTAAELYANGAHEATGQFVVGDPNIRRETANTIDIGLRGEGAVHWHLTAYLDRFDDYIYLAPTQDFADDLPVFDYRQADARFAGAEVEVMFPLWRQADRELQLRLMADYVHAELADGSPIPRIPPLRVGGELTYEAGGWRAELSAFRYAKQTRIAAYETSTDGYTLIDASVSYKWLLSKGAVSLFARGGNLTDTEARRHTSPLKDYAPLPGRSALLGVRAEF